MIHRQNWLDINTWLQYLDHVHGRHEKTIHKYRGHLRHLLEWADDVPFPNARHIDPVFPTYLITSRNDGKTTPLSYVSIYKTLVVTRAFFSFARNRWPRYQKLSDGWIDLLYPNRMSKPEPKLDDHKYYTLEEVRAITSVAAETLHEARAQAAVAMLFLSGMRGDTLVSLPLQCVDLPNMRILQIPSMGPRTKNNKAAITYLLNIPDLLDVVRRWDDRLHDRGYAPDALWYAPLNHDGMDLYEESHAIEGRSVMVRDDVEIICKKLGVKYLSPHKLRHGHIVYARSFARSADDVKAVSQNVMHSNTMITDQVYGGLVANKVQSVITNLGTQPTESGKLNTAEIMLLIEMLTAQLKT